MSFQLHNFIAIAAPRTKFSSVLSLSLFLSYFDALLFLNFVSFLLRQQISSEKNPDGPERVEFNCCSRLFRGHAHIDGTPGVSTGIREYSLFFFFAFTFIRFRTQSKSEFSRWVQESFPRFRTCHGNFADRPIGVQHGTTTRSDEWRFFSLFRLRKSGIFQKKLLTVPKFLLKWKKCDAWGIYGFGFDLKNSCGSRSLPKINSAVQKSREIKKQL